MDTRILEWDGTALPTALKGLPPGRYVIEPLDDLLPLTAEEDAGIVAALDSVDAGKGVPLDEALAMVRSRLARP